MLLKQLATIPKPTAVLLLAAAMLASWGLASQWLWGATSVSTLPANAAETSDYQVAFWADRVESNELDYLSRVNLGAAQLAEGRRTGEFETYDAAEIPLREALDLNPSYSPALSALAAVHLARHEFPAALQLSEQAYEQDPTSVEALSALGDAHLELGHYDEATLAYQRLHRRFPGAASEARLARLAFIVGQPDEAVERAKRALQLAGTSPDPAFHVALATYALDIGDIELADETAQAAFIATSSAPSAVEMLAQVRAVQGRLDEAVALYEQLLGLGPDPGAQAALGDLYTQLGQPDTAQTHYRAVEPAARAITDNPLVFDREIALFLANNQIDLDRAVELAERDLENRQDVYAYDTLAWTRYHAGIIAMAVGNNDQAVSYLNQALDINLNFDTVQAAHAQQALNDLATS